MAKEESVSEFDRNPFREQRLPLSPIDDLNARCRWAYGDAWARKEANMPDVERWRKFGLPKASTK